MKKNKTIKINLIIPALPSENEAKNELIELVKRKDALLELSEKLKQEYYAKGKKVSINVVSSDQLELRKNADFEIVMINNNQLSIIEKEINKAVESISSNMFERFFKRIKELINRVKPTTINLFVVAPKNSLKKEKERIKKCCDGLNIKKAETGKLFKIETTTYNAPENRKDVSNNHIKNKADIVIFLVDNNINVSEDDPLVDNIKLAIKQNNIFHKPEPVVFVQYNNLNNNNFELINKILATGGWVPEPYRNTKELLGKVKDKINRYTDLYPSIKSERRNSKIRYYGLRVAMVLSVILVTIIAYFLLFRDKVESRQLLVMGGGSAKNYIIKNTSLEIKDLDKMFCHYAAMASGNSYGLIAEEVIKNYNGYRAHPYYPIILSAQQAKANDFLKESDIKEFKDTGIVISIMVGYDWLVAYGSKGVFSDNVNSLDNVIRTDLLDTIIAHQVSLLKSPADSANIDSVTTKTRPITVYTTSENSGTINTYKRICDSSLITQYNSIRHHRFTDNLYLSNELNAEGGWIALGSEYYRPTNNKMDSLIVLDSTGNRITKPLYVYFMLYKHNGSYVLPKATKNFLKKIDVDKDIIKCINKKINENDTIIINDTITIKYFKGLDTYEKDSIVNITHVISDTTKILYELPYKLKKK